MSNTLKNIIFAAAIVAIIAVAMFINNHDASKKQMDMIVAVHVKGEVKNPGYYELEYGKRVKDAIEIAGGATENALLDEINLAMKLADGMEVIVPSGGGGSSSKTTSKININKANLRQLCQIEGVGESLAGKIIEYREQNDGFKSVDEIKNVSGIGEAKFEKIKEKITV